MKKEKRNKNYIECVDFSTKDSKIYILLMIVVSRVAFLLRLNKKYWYE